MSENKPTIGILMGSDSDLPIMNEAATVCEQFGVAFEMKIISAHRAPKILADYVEDAHERGIKAIIAGAGAAAHLPGVVASFTPLPVIGVPIKSKALEGLDSLFSIVQMPSGVPVATVAINGAKNAALLAMQILGTADDTLRQKFIEYKKTLEEATIKKNEKIQ